MSRENETNQTTEEQKIKENQVPAIVPRIKVQLVGSEPFYGPGMKKLLTCIREEGSMRVACDKMELSYSKGRRMIERAERELGYPIVERSHGGKNGGSARLTKAGAELLELYGKFEMEMKKTAAEKFREIFGK